jgi:hypothetical protein
VVSCNSSRVARALVTGAVAVVVSLGLIGCPSLNEITDGNAAVAHEVGPTPSPSETPSNSVPLGSPDSGLDSSDSSPPAAVCTPPAGGEACTPGMITCGGSSCKARSETCCLDPIGGDVCTPTEEDCSGIAARVDCDEGADCPAGMVCCARLDARIPPRAHAQCTTSCNPLALEFHLCHSNEECPGHDCTPQTCFAGLHTELCGGIQVGCFPDRPPGG